MDPLCLLVAGVVRAALPGEEFTLAWEHSVQKTRWEEHYRVDGSNLLLAEARIESSGAGMEPPPDAVLKNGWWSWHPRSIAPALTLARFSADRDYTLCWRDRCSALSALVGNADAAPTLVVRPCEGKAGRASK
jgi:hypothetical protein